jgi:hypothetical protein
VGNSELMRQAGNDSKNSDRADGKPRVTVEFSNSADLLTELTEEMSAMSKQLGPPEGSVTPADETTHQCGMRFNSGFRYEVRLRDCMPCSLRES